MDRKLNNTEVYKVKRMIANKVQATSIANQLGISIKLVSRIRTSKQYKNCVLKDTEQVTQVKECIPSINHSIHTSKRVLSETKVKYIKFIQVNTTFTIVQLALLFNVSRQTINSLSYFGKSQTWKHVLAPTKVERTGKLIDESIREAVKFCLKAKVFTDRVIALAFNLSTTYVSSLHIKMDKEKVA